MWVRSEYAGELAVLSAWLCALLPWSVSYATPGGIRVVRVHFLYIFFQFVPGIDLGEAAAPYRLLHQAPEFAGNSTTAFGYRLWIIAAGVFTLAIVLSVVYYRFDERLEDRSPIDPVRGMGGLLVVSGGLFGIATFFVVSGFGGLTVPVGPVFMVVLGGLLLVVDRT